MKTRTKVKTVDIDELFNNEEKDTDILSEAYVSRSFLEPFRFEPQPKYLSTDFVYATVGEMQKDDTYADGSIQFGSSEQSVTIYFAAYKPEEIQSALDKLDALENEVTDFCAKMREALEIYKIVSKIKTKE